jgi:hypothetical protein
MPTTQPKTVCTPREPSQRSRPGQLRDSGAIGANVKREWHGLLDGVVVTAGFVAQSFQEFELVGQLGRGRDICNLQR